MRFTIVTSIILFLLGSYPSISGGLFITTPAPDESEFTTIAWTGDGHKGSEAENSTSAGVRNENTSLTKDVDESDEDLGLETRSFLSSKRKNKISDSHFKLKDKKVKHADPDSKVTPADLTDDLGEWEAPEEVRKNYPYYLAGYDNEDRPIWVAEYGRFNIREMIERGPDSIALLRKYTKQCAYRIYKSIQTRDNEVGDVSTAMVILDLDGLSLYQLTHPPTLVYVLGLVRVYADMVDEFIGNAVIINANYIAEMLINLVRPLFGRAMEKVDIYGTQANKWRPALRQHIPLEFIPTWYGGSQEFRAVKVYG